MKMEIGKGLFEFLREEDLESINNYYKEHSLFSPGGKERWLHSMDEFMKVLEQHCKENPDGFLADMFPDAVKSLDEIKEEFYTAPS